MSNTIITPAMVSSFAPIAEANQRTANLTKQVKEALRSVLDLHADDVNEWALNLLKTYLRDEGNRHHVANSWESRDILDAIHQLRKAVITDAKRAEFMANHAVVATPKDKVKVCKKAATSAYHTAPLTGSVDWSKQESITVAKANDQFVGQTRGNVVAGAGKKNQGKKK